MPAIVPCVMPIPESPEAIWYRLVTLCLLAQAVLAAVRRLADGESDGEPELIALTIPEARRRLLWSRLPEPDEVLGWSEWRRAHRAFARRCHYKKRGTEPPDSLQL
jgi:hypothetical protein